MPVLVLSALDIHTVLSVLFPRVDPNPFSWDQRSAKSFSSSLYSVPLRTEQIRPSSRPQSVSDYTPSANIQRYDGPNFGLPQPYSGNMFQGAQMKASPGEPSFQSLELCREFESLRDELPIVLDGRLQCNLNHPCDEDWAVFSFESGSDYPTVNRLLGSSDAAGSSDQLESATGADVLNAHTEKQDQERLDDAIVELVEEMTELEDSQVMGFFDGRRAMTLQTLDEMFQEAMEYCKSQSDYVKAHYWWDSRNLFRGLNPTSASEKDTPNSLSSLLQVTRDSIQASREIIKSYERSFSYLQKSFQRFGSVLKSTFSGLAVLRDKMWYMTDVKHSSRYDEAKNVALALKNMGYLATVRRAQPNSTSRFRSHIGGSGSSILQNPEVQTMNIMKTSTEQGGPNKLADEQVDMTRRWLKRSGIENFCQGEERIHRFCLEIKLSVGKIIGETMTDGPVLWASDLYQLERTLYDSPTTRPPSVRNAVRPSSIASEDSLFAMPPMSSGLRSTDGQSRMGSESYGPPLNKLSSPSLVSERWRVTREKENFDAGSIGDSPGKAVSTSTVESYNTIWSPVPPKIRSSTSVSSLRSRPSSIYNDSLGLRAADRVISAKMKFLEDLKQTLTSLLLSDLGSPVWSTGCETDAWFSPALAQERTRLQAQKDEEDWQRPIRRGSTQSLNDLSQMDCACQRSGRQRSKSVEPSRVQRTSIESPELLSASIEDIKVQPPPNPKLPSFEYKEAFTRLLEKFSRHSNPFTKLNALHELRQLILASLTDDSLDNRAVSKDKGRATFGAKMKCQQSPQTPESQIGDAFGKQAIRSNGSIHPPLLYPFESPNWTPGDGGLLEKTLRANAVVDVLQELLRETAPKTLFRDLQLIAAFVPPDILNKTERGLAFLDAGVAALRLKQVVCQKMVELADSIVAQEVQRRSPLPDPTSRRKYTMADAAKMWIITAKEGNAVAQRELAILYLTHPELLPRVTFPMTMPRETFKAEMMYRRNDDTKRSDPQTMCLALHWMQLSASGGDEVAKDNLRQREEFDSIT
jgi:hypothetical protein